VDRHGRGLDDAGAAEIAAADAGLGEMVFNVSNFLRTDVMILGILLIGIVAYSFELLMNAGPCHGREGSENSGTTGAFFFARVGRVRGVRGSAAVTTFSSSRQ
jgi:hypothetical protein